MENGISTGVSGSLSLGGDNPNNIITLIIIMDEGKRRETGDGGRGILLRKMGQDGQDGDGRYLDEGTELAPPPCPTLDPY